MKIKYRIVNFCSMVHPQVAGGGNVVWMWKVAANILNKQLWISTMLQSVAVGFEFRWILWNDLSSGK
jgi:hypothetical protein